MEKYDVIPQTNEMCCLPWRTSHVSADSVVVGGDLVFSTIARDGARRVWLSAGHDSGTDMGGAVGRVTFPGLCPSSAPNEY